jgi:hypothetical protein
MQSEVYTYIYECSARLLFIKCKSRILPPPPFRARTRGATARHKLHMQRRANKEQLTLSYCEIKKGLRERVREKCCHSGNE